MSYTLQQIKDALLSNVYEVRDIFYDTFGERNVDLQLPCQFDDDMRRALNNYAYHVQGETDTWEVVSPKVPCFNSWIRDEHPVDEIVIMVYWPSVTITNEYGKSVKIDDLYAKIPILLSGKMQDKYRSGFVLNRGKYSALQFHSNYMHSHIAHIPFDISVFMEPCLGDGPIKQTINTLRTEYSKGIWRLFCHELSVYVTVESIKGIPYNRLENIGYRRGRHQGQFTGFNAPYTEELPVCSHYALYNYNAEPFRPTLLRNFIHYYLYHNHLKINYANKVYSIGMTYYDFMLDISNAFISYFNEWCEEHKEELFGGFDMEYNRHSLTHSVKVYNETFYFDTSTQNSGNVSNIGRKVCTFKGKDVLLKVYGTNNEDQPDFTTHLLSQNMAMYILYKILQVLNFHSDEFGQTNATNQKPNGGEAAQIGERQYYL